MDPVRKAAPLSPELRTALDAVFKAHVADILAFLCSLGANRTEADDIAHETFLVLVEEMASGNYDPSTPVLPWLRIAARRILDRHRKRQTRRARRDLEACNPVTFDAGMDAEHREDMKQRWAIVLELLGTLPPERRMVLVMHELEEMTTAAIAAALELPPGTVSNRLRLAREDLAAALVRMRADEQRAPKFLGALVLPLDAATLLRELPALEVSEAHRARLWRRLQVAIGAPPVAMQPVAPLPRAPSGDLSASPSLLRTASGRVAVALIVCGLGATFALGIAVGMLLALRAPARPMPMGDRSVVVYTSAPVETASLAPGAAPTAAAPSPLPRLPALPASAARARAAPEGQSEARLLGIARLALRREPRDPSAALQALATRARIWGTDTPFQGEAALLQKEAEDLLRASPAPTP